MTRFQPSLILSNFSNCLIFTLVEAVVIKICMMTAMSGSSRFLELLSIASYKYIG
jgi:hypothetical protein